MVLGLEIIGCLGAGRRYDVQCALMEAASNHLETPLMGWEGGIFDPGRFVPDPLGSLSAQLGHGGGGSVPVIQLYYLGVTLGQK